MESPGARRPIAKMSREMLLVLLLWATPAHASELSVVQRNLTFSSTNVTMQVGDRLNIHNADSVTHNITVRGAGEDEDADDLGLQKPGTDVSYRFVAPGTYMVVCSIHPRMRLIVHVK
jgi:plastocyanin